MSHTATFCSLKPRQILPQILTLGLMLALGACAHGRHTYHGEPQPGSAPNTRPGTARVVMTPNDVHVPDFARKPYQPFSRTDAIAIAMREWRLFGQPVHDEQPGSEPPPLPDQKPERMPGLWQRVGEYWFESQDAAAKESAWSGKHDEFGLEFDAANDATYAWSAAFISYVMRIAGAGDRFPYSSVHSDYINLARMQSMQGNGMWVVSALPPATTAPQPGDLICTSRATKVPLRFEDLPTANAFPSHCDLVVATQPGQLTVIGGNVEDAVSMKHVPVTAAGLLTEPDGSVVDTRYNWFVVLRVLYDR